MPFPWEEMMLYNTLTVLAKTEVLVLKLWEGRKRCFSKYFLKLSKQSNSSNVQSYKGSPSLSVLVV